MTQARAWAEIDLGAVRHNTAVLAAMAAPGRLCVVVKANAYGHGAVAVAGATLDAGASWLAVATIEEGAELRDAAIQAPVLLLSEPPPEAMAEVVGLMLTPTIYTEVGAAALEAAASASVGTVSYPVHLKVDTGMRRVGASPGQAVKLALALQASPTLELAGVWTHFAVADDPDDPFTAEQDGRLSSLLDDLEQVGVRPGVVHSCNSAGLLVGDHARRDMVRCGIAVYGVAPAARLRGIADLRPAMSLKARVSHVKEVEPGEGVSYGLRYRTPATTMLATVPVGYADGVGWRLGPGGGEVLVRGGRAPIAGSVTMDQIVVDCGPGSPVAVGDEVVLLGRQGDETIDAWDWAARAGTIAYEVLCGIGPRVPRLHSPS